MRTHPPDQLRPHPSPPGATRVPRLCPPGIALGVSNALQLRRRRKVSTFPLGCRVRVQPSLASSRDGIAAHLLRACRTIQAPLLSPPHRAPPIS
ncbi:hypothetical protein [Pseudonocardia sp. TRM90224]|uniref:hypothetical protein n=1 Tax=Pseudonocardia sp. TRM90224 TaxID=2812678 RepID=UPI001E2FFC3F|nr:hypothetical protein [Pseudonocardia sp. TRM90224]